MSFRQLFVHFSVLAVPPSEVAPVLVTALAKTAGFIPRMQDNADNAA